MEFINYPTRYHDVVSILCDYLEYTQLKSLSLISREWFEATSPFFVERSTLILKDEGNEFDVNKSSRTHRNFKYYNFCNSEYDSLDIQPLLKWYKETKSINKNYQIKKLKICGFTLHTSILKLLKEFERIKFLEIWYCLHPRDLTEVPVDLTLNLEELRFYVGMGDDRWGFTFMNIVQRNNTLKNVDLYFFHNVGPHDSGLLNLTTLRNLRSVTFKHSTRLKWDTFREICRNNANLQSFSEPLSWDNEPYSYKDIAKFCPDIKVINMNYYDTLHELENLSKIVILRVEIRVSGNSTKALTDLSDVQLGQLREFKIADYSYDRNKWNVLDIEKVLLNKTCLTHLTLDYYGDDLAMLISIISLKLTNLISLDLDCKKGVDDSHSKDYKMNTFEKLKVLRLHYSQTNDEFLGNIHAPNLRIVSLERMTMGIMGHFLRESLLMENFCVNKNDFSDDFILNILKSLKFLKHLNLNKSENLTWRSLDTFLEHYLITSSYCTNSLVEGHYSFIDMVMKKGFNVERKCKCFFDFGNVENFETNDRFLDDVFTYGFEVKNGYRTITIEYPRSDHKEYRENNVYEWDRRIGTLIDPLMMLD